MSVSGSTTTRIRPFYLTPRGSWISGSIKVSCSLPPPAVPFSSHIHPYPLPPLLLLIMSSPFDLQLHAFHRGWLVNVPLVRQNEPISNTTAQNKTHLGMFLDTEMVSNDASLWQDGLGFNGDAHHGKIPTTNNEPRSAPISFDMHTVADDAHHIGLLPANVPTLADVSAYDVVESFGDTAPLLFNPFLPVPESADIALAIHFDSRISSLLDAAARNPAIIALPSVQNAYRSVQTLECWRQGMREFAEKGEWYRLGEIALNPKKWALMPKVSSSYFIVS